MTSELVTEANKAVDAIEMFVAAYQKLLGVNWIDASCGLLDEQRMKVALLRAADGKSARWAKQCGITLTISCRITRR